MKRVIAEEKESFDKEEEVFEKSKDTVKAKKKVG